MKELPSLESLFALVVSTAILSACSANPPRTEAPQGEVCKATSEQEISALFDRWNAALQTGDPHQVTLLYAEKSVLLATVSNTPRITPAQKEDYFHHFLDNRPVGRIDSRHIEIHCNTAVDSGLYTFTFQKTGQVVKARFTYTYFWDGQRWLITHHHSSRLPEPS